MPMKTPDEQRKFQREWIAARKLEWIVEQGHGCAKCGMTEGPFDIDHIDRTKKTMNASQMFSRRPEIYRKELENCQVLCKPCHKQKTRSEVMKIAEHGTMLMYKKRGCRCDECRACNAQKVREQRAKYGR